MSKLLRFLIISLIKAYRYCISPMLGPSCRYIPTCSEYAIDSINHRGCMRGGALSVARILKCHPFGGQGFDEIKHK